jgi:hypothetical protein
MHTRVGLLIGSTLLMTVLVLQGGSATSVVAGVAAVAIASAVAARYASRVVLRSEMVVRVRSHARRQAESAVPAPQHPQTPGRRRSRAPSLSIATPL